MHPCIFIFHIVLSTSPLAPQTTVTGQATHSTTTMNRRMMHHPIILPVISIWQQLHWLAIPWVRYEIFAYVGARIHHQAAISHAILLVLLYLYICICTPYRCKQGSLKKNEGWLCVACLLVCMRDERQGEVSECQDRLKAGEASGCRSPAKQVMCDTWRKLLLFDMCN